MATSTIPLLTTVLAFIVGVALILYASSQDEPSSILLTLGTMGIFLSFLVNVVFH